MDKVSFEHYLLLRRNEYLSLDKSMADLYNEYKQWEKEVKEDEIK